jgi:hypothetical protein
MGDPAPLSVDVGAGAAGDDTSKPKTEEETSQ